MMFSLKKFCNLLILFIYLFQASLDEPTQTVIMHRTEPTRLQYLALQLSEKVTNLVENNERIMEMKQGSFFYQKQGKGCTLSYVVL